MKLRVWDTRISLQDVAGTPGAPPKQKLQDGNLNVLGGTKPTGSVRPGRPKTSQAIERISIHDIMSIRIAPLLIQIDQFSYKLPKPFGHPWANPVPNVDPNPGFPGIPLPWWHHDSRPATGWSRSRNTRWARWSTWFTCSGGSPVAAAKWVDSYWCSLWFMTHDGSMVLLYIYIW